MDWITLFGLVLALLGIGLTLIFVVWQPKHPVLRAAIGGAGLVLIASAAIVLVGFAPIHWQSPIVFRSPITKSPAVISSTAQSTSLPATPAATPSASSVAEGIKLSGLILHYGACSAGIDGSKLSEWQDKYQVALICGYNDPGKDKYRARAISISPLSIIRPEEIQLIAPHSRDMTNAIERAVDDVLRNSRQPSPGELVLVHVPTWNEIVLFPAGLDLSDIHRLADVREKGGMILSRDYPNCVDCSSQFMLGISRPPRPPEKSKTTSFLRRGAEFFAV